MRWIAWIEIAIVYVQIIITKCKKVLFKYFRKNNVENIYKKWPPQHVQSKKKSDRLLKNKGALIIEDVFERPKMVAVGTSRRITKLN
jgi:hypothetical protein